MIQMRDATRRVLWTLVLAAALAAPSARSGDLLQEGAGAAAVSGSDWSCVAELQSALAALDAGDAEGALNHYRAALGTATSDSLRFQALLGLGSTYAALRQADKAMPALERARDLAPDNAEVWYVLGTVYKEAGQSENALQAFGVAARLEPGLAAAHADRCLLLSELGRYREATAACQSALEADPSHAPAWIGLGVASYQLGAFEDAAAAFREALRAQPGSGRARYGLGLSLLFVGDREGAVAQYVQLKELDPALAQDLYRRVFP